MKITQKKTLKPNQCGQQAIKEAPTRATYPGPGKPSPAQNPRSYITVFYAQCHN